MSLFKYYVYVLLDPRRPGDYKFGKYKFTHEPFYVGKGCDARADAHFKGFMQTINSPKPSTNIRKWKRLKNIYEETGLSPIVVFKHRGVHESESYRLEMKVIDAIGFGRQGPLLNLTAGGKGGLQAQRSKLSEKSKRNISKAIKEVFRNKDLEYWQERASKVTSTWEIVKHTKPQVYKTRCEINKEQAKSFWESDKGKSFKVAKSVEQRKVMLDRYANMTPLEAVKFKTKLRLGRLLKRLCVSDKRRQQIKEKVYSFIETSRHRSSDSFTKSVNCLFLELGIN